MDYAGDEWRGRIGKGWASEWERTDRSFAGLTGSLVDMAIAALPPASNHRLHILDIGCGAGETSLALSEARSDADITGIDLSPELIGAARMRGRGHSACRFEEGDATCWRAGHPFDAALSRHGVMFFADPVTAFAHMRTLLRPGATFAFSCFGDRAQNPWAGEAMRLLDGPPAGDPHAPGPFAFADVARVTAILSEAGWTGTACAPLDYSYVAGAGEDPVADALSYFSRIGPAAPVIAALARDERRRFDAQFGEMLALRIAGGVVRYPAFAWLWKARA